MTTHRALLVDRDTDGIRAELTELDDSALPVGDVEIAVTHSSLNYADAVVTTLDAGLVPSFPIVPGFDLAGAVTSSTYPGIAAGDRVLATGWGLGMTRPGGFTERTRLPGGQVTRIPQGMDTAASMILGTAGLTAAMSIDALTEHGLEQSAGDVLVTGASGGVGSLSVALLATHGFRVVASTGSPDAEPMLRDIGAAEVIGRMEGPTEPMGPERWAGAIDVVGGTTLARVISELRYGGVVAACGLVAGTPLPTDVLPFVLRGVGLIGIASVYAPVHLRDRLWADLAATDTSWLDRLSSTVGLDKVPDAAQRLLGGSVHGRILVHIGG